MSVMQTTKVNFFFFLFCTKIPVLIILVTEKKLKVPICMLIRKDGVEQFVGTYMAYLHMAYIHTGRKYGPKVDSIAGNLTFLHVSQPRRKKAAGRTAHWEGKSSGSQLNGREREYLVYSEEEAGMALEQQALQVPTPKCHGVDPRCRKWLNWNDATGSFNCKARGVGRKRGVWERIRAHSSSLGFSAVR